MSFSQIEQVFTILAIPRFWEIGFFVFGIFQWVSLYQPRSLVGLIVPFEIVIIKYKISSENQ